MKALSGTVVILAIFMISLPLAAAQKTLTEKDDEKLVNLGVGDKLIINLPGNYTTGYQWEVKEGYDDDVIKQKGKGEYQPEKTDLVGAGGIATFTFKAAGIGRTDLNLEYRRPWEKDGDVPEDFEITVVVKKGKGKGKKALLEQEE
jgi:inhibitor of cysteine peptidase